MVRKTVFSFLVLGLVALLAVQAEATNIVVNGSFETGNFSGWTQFGNTGFTGVQLGSFGGIAPTDGAYQAFFGPVGSTGGITQSLATIPSGFYWVSFDVANLGGTPNSFAADWGGLTFLAGTNVGVAPYTHFAFTLMAAGASTALTFTTRQDPSFFLVDNVNVQSMPEPGTMLLLATGLAAGARAARRRFSGRA
jgi:hypothetical protein